MGKSRQKRSITIARHRTSISLEDAFWDALAKLAEVDGRSIADLVREIDWRRGGSSRSRGNLGETALPETSLSAAIRLYLLKRMQARDA